MDAMEKLTEHLSGRMLTYAKLKEDGVKVVGYNPGGYVPEELIYAAGAIPIGLGDGGAPEPTTESLSMVPRFLCTFNRSQIGYWKLNTAVHYRLPDLLAIGLVDVSAKAFADAFSYFADMDVYRIGVPHEKTELSVPFFLNRLEGFKKKLEEITGNVITDEKLKAQFGPLNKRRRLLKAISEMRIGANPVISSRDFARLHHASFLADRDVYNELLEELLEELKPGVNQSEPLRRPRIMLIASTLARGDDRIFDIVDKYDAEIVTEEVSEGFQPYCYEVSEEGDPMAAIVKAYFEDRMLGPWCRPFGDRYEQLLATAKKYETDGVIWYQTMYREGADMQAWSFGHDFKEDGYSFVKIQTDYNAAEMEQMRTRIETFIDLMSSDREAEYVK